MTSLKNQALDYHALPTPGKLGISITKSMTTQHDLSLAYSPGVAAPVEAIAEDPEKAYRYTNKGNLVAVISNGTAVLGLGNMGALASKPVMEGKAALFKQFANIDVYDIEVDTKDPDAFIETVVNIAPTFGGINLEDIKAPDCFYIEEQLKARLNIPVFHDDQHGTAVSIAAGLMNALDLQKKSLNNCKITCIGAGAAAIASMQFLISLGATHDQIHLIDSKGLVTKKRNNINRYKAAFAQDQDTTSLATTVKNSDILIGLASPDIVTPEMLQTMNDNPIIFTLSNPDPEINYQLAKDTRQDAIIATGRSDLPNQINNVLCFPYLFKGALQKGARAITHKMLHAAAHAIADLARQDTDTFGPEHIIPKPFDRRLNTIVSQAVANAVD